MGLAGGVTLECCDDVWAGPMSRLIIFFMLAAVLTFGGGGLGGDLLCRAERVVGSAMVR
jgi:hypothetical protein